MKTLPILLIVLGMVASPLAAQEIYRVVDEDGNVIYTDRKPSDDAEPLDLPGLNVLREDDTLPVLDEPAEGDDAPPLEFEFETPSDGAVISSADGSIPVLLSINIDLPEAAELVLLVNGEELDPVQSLDVTLHDVPPGQYQLRAVLQTPAGRPIASTETIEFEARSLDENWQP